jgi:hypothetical protein
MGAAADTGEFSRAGRILRISREAAGPARVDLLRNRQENGHLARERHGTPVALRVAMMTIRVSSTIAVLSLFAACSGRPAAPAARTAPATDASLPAVAVGQAGVQATAASAPAETTPAKDATTVEAVWKTRTALAGKTVTLHGKVVKYNGGILGVNWIHIQDGSGSAADGTNDITVTSDAEVQIGDVITVTGTVTIDKDLGSGYNYPVIIERASIARAISANR